MDPLVSPAPANQPTRPALLARGESLAAISVGYNFLEGLIAIGAGLIAGSAALAGFGFDSVIEVTSAAVLWWRLRRERMGSATGPEGSGERIASRIAGALLLILAAGISVAAARQLATGAEPAPSWIGILLTAISLVVMPLLARAKLKVAAGLGSRALRADAHETVACAWLSGTTLIGLTLNAAAGWWWADPLCAVLLVPRIAREGWEAWRGEEMEDCEGDGH